MARWRVDYRDVTKDKHLGTVEAAALVRKTASKKSQSGQIPRYSH